jgi:CRISPR-associated endoribonuclease Cas6
MRIKLAIGCERLPIIYRHHIAAFIENAWRSAGGTGSEPPYTFNLALPKKYDTVNEEFEMEGITISDVCFRIPCGEHLTVYLSSPDSDFITRVVEGMKTIAAYRIDDEGELKFLAAAGTTDRKISGRHVNFKICSPVYMDDGSGNAIIPTEKEQLLKFNTQFNLIHDRLLASSRGRGLREPLEVRPTDVKKKVVKHAISKLRKGKEERERLAAGRPFEYLTSFTGHFEVTGHPEDLQYLYDSGIGLNTAHGFGMVELIHQKQNNEEVV